MGNHPKGTDGVQAEPQLRPRGERRLEGVKQRPMAEKGGGGAGGICPDCVRRNNTP